GDGQAGEPGCDQVGEVFERETAFAVVPGGAAVEPGRQFAGTSGPINVGFLGHGASLALGAPGGAWALAVEGGEERFEQEPETGELGRCERAVWCQGHPVLVALQHLGRTRFRIYEPAGAHAVGAEETALFAELGHRLARRTHLDCKRGQGVVDESPLGCPVTNIRQPVIRARAYACSGLYPRVAAVF